jgi:lipopolysaccharide/colanic/teichoic acid biosynthesis glycosyltransferase
VGVRRFELTRSSAAVKRLLDLLGASLGLLAMLPLMVGMTGPWQILRPTRVPLREMVAIDYLYATNWSLWKDLKILLRTVPHVVGRRGL